MFNFGFGDVVDRIEKYFGPTVTKIVLFVLVTAAVLLVVGVTAQQVLVPFVTWLYALFTGNPDYAETRIGISWIATIVWAVVTLAFVVTAFRMRRQFLDFLGKQERVAHAVGAIEKFQAGLRAALKDNPEDAAPQVLALLDELAADDKKHEAKIAPIQRLMSDQGKVAGSDEKG